MWSFVTERLDRGAFGQILRYEGFFTLASRPNATDLWSQADSVARVEPTAARDTHVTEVQELGFIGTDLNRDALQAARDTLGIDDTCVHEHAVTEAEFRTPSVGQSVARWSVVRPRCGSARAASTLMRTRLAVTEASSGRIR